MNRLSKIIKKKNDRAAQLVKNQTYTVFVDGGEGATPDASVDSVDHGQLAGLGDDDHPQYTKKDMSAVTEKATPHDDDVLLINDSEAAGALKKVKVSNIGGSELTTYYEPVTNGDTASPEIVFHDGDVVMAEV